MMKHNMSSMASYMIGTVSESPEDVSVLFVRHVHRSLVTVSVESSKAKACFAPIATTASNTEDNNHLNAIITSKEVLSISPHLPPSRVDTSSASAGITTLFDRIVMVMMRDESHDHGADEWLTKCVWFDTNLFRSSSSGCVTVLDHQHLRTWHKSRSSGDQVDESSTSTADAIISPSLP